MADSLASMKSYPDTKFHVYWYYAIELREFKEKEKKEKNNMEKLF